MIAIPPVSDDVLRWQYYAPDRNRTSAAESDKLACFRNSACHTGALCILLYFLFVHAIACQAAEMSPLLELSQRIYCAESSDEAREYVEQLYSAPLAEYGLPTEYLKFSSESHLFAGTLDAVLYVLYDIQQRYPELRLLVERTVLRWNYCWVFHKKWILDLMVKDGKVAQQTALRPFPLGSKGFFYWGFLDPDPEDRIVPLLLSDSPLDHRHFQYFFHQIYRKQCFPHPDTGRLFYEHVPNPLFSPIHQKNVFQSQREAAYPFTWDPECTKIIIKTEKAPEGPEVPQIQTIKPPLPEPAAETKPVTVMKPPAEIKAVTVMEPPAVIQNPVVPKPALPEPVAKDKAKPPPAPVSNRLQHLELPTADDSPMVSVNSPSSSGTAGVATPLPKKNSLGFTGNFYYRKPLEKDGSAGGTISWTPAPYWFIRGGFDYKYKLDEDKFSYSWGIGYDDWHPGTFSLQLNNWGPILPGEGLKFKSSVINLAYKIKSDTLKKYHISGSAGIDFPIEGTAIVNTTWQWEPINTWFIRVGLQVTLDHEKKVRATYNFGRWDWHPFTLALTYDNWGPNELPRTNFKENGAITLAWSWAF
jgi:hypothetical protein